MHDTLSGLLTGLQEFADPDIHRGTVASMRDRLARAETIVRRSVTGPLVADRWQEACEAIAAHPAHGGLHLRPQLALVPIGPDPDIDVARDFFLQDLWYSQGLAKYAWLQGPNRTSVEQNIIDLIRGAYFTDGYRIVVWPSGSPVSLLEADYVAWDKPR